MSKVPLYMNDVNFRMVVQIRVSRTAVKRTCNIEDVQGQILVLAVRS